MPGKEEAYTNVISIIIVIIFAVSIVAIASTLTESGNFGIAQGQGNNIISSSITPEQRDAICNPNNPLSMLKSVNTTESKICGIPKTQSSNITTTSAAANTTTGTEALLPSSAIPGLFMPEQPPSQPTQSESIQPPSAKSIAPSAKSIAPSEAPPQFPPTG